MLAAKLTSPVDSWRPLGSRARGLLDLVIADVLLPSTVSVKAFSHLLGSSRVGVRVAGLEGPLAQALPRSPDGAPLLMPGEDSAVGQQLRAWFTSQRLRPRIVAEFDDSALAQEFGRQGVGYLLAPEVLGDEIESRHLVQHVGTIDGVKEHFYAISVERRITHTCVLAITRAARGELFQPTARAKTSRAGLRRKAA